MRLRVTPEYVRTVALWIIANWPEDRMPIAWWQDLVEIAVDPSEQGRAKDISLALIDDGHVLVDFADGSVRLASPRQPA